MATKFLKKGMGLEYFINKANTIHGEYDYSLIKEYEGVMKKYPIICKEHGVWEVSLDNHINKKSKCPKCKGHKLTYLEKITQANRIHNFKYDYSLITKDFKTDTVVPIICKDHGIFKQLWTNHIHPKHECPKCAVYGRNSLTLDNIKEKVFNLGHDFEYDWDSYKGYYDPGFRIKCPKHGWFKQQISNHLFGQRCPKCNNSKGEESVELFLKENNIKYETQKKFDKCINPETNHKLKFDFYLPKQNICVEYDGQLHTIPVKFFGGQKALDKQIRLDQIKNQFCKDNNIGLIRIAYIEFSNINLILKGLLDS